MQLTCTLSMSDRDPWSLEEHQAPALNNRVSATDSGPCPDLGQTDCPAGALYADGLSLDSRDGRTDSRTAGQRAACVPAHTGWLQRVPLLLPGTGGKAEAQTLVAAVTLKCDF